MTMTVAFRAETREDAIAAATAWAEREPRWVLGDVIETEQQRPGWWRVRVRLEPVQEVLGL